MQLIMHWPSGDVTYTDETVLTIGNIVERFARNDFITIQSCQVSIVDLDGAIRNILMANDCTGIACNITVSGVGYNFRVTDGFTWDEDYRKVSFTAEDLPTEFDSPLIKLGGSVVPRVYGSIKRMPVQQFKKYDVQIFTAASVIPGTTSFAYTSTKPLDNLVANFTLEGVPCYGTFNNGICTCNVNTDVVTGVSLQILSATTGKLSNYGDADLTHAVLELNAPVFGERYFGNHKIYVLSQNGDDITFAYTSAKKGVYKLDAVKKTSFLSIPIGTEVKLSEGALLYITNCTPDRVELKVGEGFFSVPSKYYKVITHEGYTTLSFNQAPNTIIPNSEDTIYVSKKQASTGLIKQLIEDFSAATVTGADGTSSGFYINDEVSIESLIFDLCFIGRYFLRKRGTTYTIIPHYTSRSVSHTYTAASVLLRSGKLSETDYSSIYTHLVCEDMEYTRNVNKFGDIIQSFNFQRFSDRGNISKSFGFFGYRWSNRWKLITFGTKIDSLEVGQGITVSIPNIVKGQVCIALEVEKDYLAGTQRVLAIAPTAYYFSGDPENPVVDDTNGFDFPIVDKSDICDFDAPVYTSYADLKKTSDGSIRIDLGNTKLSRLYLDDEIEFTLNLGRIWATKKPIIVEMHLEMWDGSDLPADVSFESPTLFAFEENVIKSSLKVSRTNADNRYLHCRLVAVAYFKYDCAGEIAHSVSSLETFVFPEVVPNEDGDLIGNQYINLNLTCQAVAIMGDQVELEVICSGTPTHVKYPLSVTVELYKAVSNNSSFFDFSTVTLEFPDHMNFRQLIPWTVTAALADKLVSSAYPLQVEFLATCKYEVERRTGAKNGITTSRCRLAVQKQTEGVGSIFSQGEYDGKNISFKQSTVLTDHVVGELPEKVVSAPSGSTIYVSKDAQDNGTNYDYKTTGSPINAVSYDPNTRRLSEDVPVGKIRDGKYIALQGAATRLYKETNRNDFAIVQTDQFNADTKATDVLTYINQGRVHFKNENVVVTVTGIQLTKAFVYLQIKSDKTCTLVDSDTQLVNTYDYNAKTHTENFLIAFKREKYVLQGWIGIFEYFNDLTQIVRTVYKSEYSTGTHKFSNFIELRYFNCGRLMKIERQENGADIKEEVFTAVLP